MEVVSRTGGGRAKTELHHMSKKWKDHRNELSPERTKVWTEPPSHKHRKVPVVYYLSRNGHLEHPHFIEVPLSSPDGLFLRDVIERLNTLRGKGMAALYSWSSKRSYKSGFVWHDLAENDFIYPAHGQEYVLKGSELVEASGTGALVSRSDDAISSLSKKSSPETRKSGEEFDFPVVTRRRNQSWSAIDLHEYKVYTGETSTGRVAADASTQTDDRRRRRRATMREEEEEIEDEEKGKEVYHENESSELCREDISPPPSDSSPETLESLMKADGKLILRLETEEGNSNGQPTAGNKIKASSVLMQLLSCGSLSFRDCGPGAYGKDNPGFSLVSHYKSRMLPRGEGSSNQEGKDAGEATVEHIGIYGRKNRGKKEVVTENKEYFSGSLIETKRDEFPALKRSNSYNADQSYRTELTTREKEMEVARAKCIMGGNTKAKGESLRRNNGSSSSSSSSSLSKAVVDNDNSDDNNSSTTSISASTPAFTCCNTSVVNANA